MSQQPALSASCLAQKPHIASAWTNNDKDQVLNEETYKSLAAYNLLQSGMTVAFLHRAKRFAVSVMEE